MRLGQEPSLAFAPSTIASLTPGGAGAVPGVRVYFFGLFGPNGPLPLHLTEFARQRLRNAGDPTLSRFADIFHHRLLCLFYRAWADAQPCVAYDRPAKDRFRAYVGALAGRGTPGTWDRDELRDEAKLFYTGHFALQTRNAEGLADVLSGYFGVSFHIEEHVGDWLEIPERDQLRLGESAETGSLGMSTILGERIWSCDHRFRVVAGPLALEAFIAFLPGAPALTVLGDIVRNYAGDEFSWDLQLVLGKDDVPGIVLGRKPRLGLTTWLSTGELAEHPADVTIDDSRCIAS